MAYCSDGVSTEIRLSLGNVLWYHLTELILDTEGSMSRIILKLSGEALAGQKDRI
jgi:hypothetical protein